MKLQLPPDPLTRGLPPPEPHALCPQLNLLNTLPPTSRPANKIPGYATGRMKPQVQIDRDRERFAYSLHVIVREIIYSGRRIFLLLGY